MTDVIVSRMIKIVRENLIYMSYGEWDGNPETVNQVDTSFLYEMKALCEAAIRQKEREHD